MTRKKVKLAYISSDSARKAAYKKRKRGLLKKVSELKTLCGIDACAIIFSPYESHPEIWPSPSGVQRVLSQFKKMSDMEQSKKMENQESFLRQRIAKASEQLQKQRKDNREKEMTIVMFQSVTGSQAFLDLNMMGLNDLGWQIEQNLREISKRIKTLNPEPHSSNDKASLQVEKSSGLDQINMEDMNKQEWFVDSINTQEHMEQEMMSPYGDSTHNTLWSNPFYL